MRKKAICLYHKPLNSLIMPIASLAKIDDCVINRIAEQMIDEMNHHLLEEFVGTMSIDDENAIQDFVVTTIKKSALCNQC